MTPDPLVTRAVALGLMARLFDPDATRVMSDLRTGEAQRALELLGIDAGARVLGALDAGTLDDASVAASAVHWFDHGRVPPYEYSNVGRSAGGHTAGLADVSGFYRAFGVEVRTDRVDHLASELEFLSLVLLRESEALQRGLTDEADVCAGAARAFLRDHVGRWIDAWAARIGEADPDGPWGPLGAVAARLVAAEARHRNVLPLHTPAAFEAGGGGVVDDEEASCDRGLVSM